MASAEPLTLTQKLRVSAVLGCPITFSVTPDEARTLARMIDDAETIKRASFDAELRAAIERNARDRLVEGGRRMATLWLWFAAVVAALP